MAALRVSATTFEFPLRSFAADRRRFPRNLWVSVSAAAVPSTLRRNRRRSPPRKNLLRHRRPPKPPTDPGIKRFPLREVKIDDQNLQRLHSSEEEEDEKDDNGDMSSVWTAEELEAISSLFERRAAHRNPKNPASDRRPRPLPSPYTTRRHSGIPTPKHHARSVSRSALVSSRSYISDRIRKNPEALIAIAREIADLPPDDDAGKVLDRWSPFIRKGSLSLTIRELGHVDLPHRALQTFCWAQDRRPELFPDDRILAATVTVLARAGDLKLEGDSQSYLRSSSQVVMEAMAKGFIKAGHLHQACKLLSFAKQNNLIMNSSVHAKLIWEAGRTPHGYNLASKLLDELAEREDFDLQVQDYTAIMKVCIKLKRFDAVESLFNWFKNTGGSNPSVVMYTTVLHGRNCSKRYREGMALIWEMEAAGCLLDIPSYRVIIRTCLALNDLARAARYASKLKEAGFSPTYDIYRDMIVAYNASGRTAKCKEMIKEVEMAGMRLDRETANRIFQS